MSGESLSGVIDVNATLADPSETVDHARWGPTDTAQLAREGIALALVRHRESNRVGPAVADAILREALHGHPEARLVASISDPALADLEANLARIRGLDPAAIWLEPRAGWTEAPLLTRELARGVAGLGRPLIAPHRRFGDALAIGEATRDLGIPVIVAGLHYMHASEVVVAGRQYPHLVFETSQFAGFALIERLVRELGADRLAFGSGFPIRPPRAPLFAVLAARISTADRAQILAGTAARALGIAAPTPAGVEGPGPRAWPDTYDVHTHTYPSPWDSPDTDAEALAERLTVFGTRRFNASSVAAIYGEVAHGNEAAIRAAEALGQRVYVVVNPADLATSEAQLDRWRSSPVVCGVKMHGTHSRTPTASPDMLRLAPALRRFGRPVLIHVQGDGWERAIGELAGADERLPWILAHAGPGAATVAAGRLAAERPNIWVELASSMPDDRVLPAVVAAAGREKLLFGSDAPLIDPAFVLGVYDRHVPTEWRSAVAVDNPRALFG